jgi:membrane associated rhomboid family serine protease
MSEFNQYRPQSNFGIPMVVKNLLIINVLFFAGTLLSTNVDFYQLFGLHFPTAPNFKVWQPITYMFMHGDVMHIFFNMFGLYMFGSQLEKYWGPKRFLTYYMVTGIGAAIVHFTVFYFVSMPRFENELNILAAQGYAIPDSLWDEFLNGNLVVGASGAIFGLLLAFGMLFPNTELMMLFFPVPIKAKYFVIGYGLIELFSGVRAAEGDNVAHFAHLGGMLFGFILIKYWNKTMRNRFY